MSSKTSATLALNSKGGSTPVDGATLNKVSRFGVNKRLAEKIESCKRLSIAQRAELDELIAKERRRRELLHRPHFAEILDLLGRLRGSRERDGMSGEGVGGDLDSSVIPRLIELLHPWRKGPFRLGKIEVDAEWRSDLKWARVERALNEVPLEGRTIADIGCGNGYYMFRLLELAQRRGEVIESLSGFDPSEHFALQFELLHAVFAEPPCTYDLLGAEELDVLAGCFDLILFMGVLYHQRDTFGALQRLRRLMSERAVAVVETLVLPGDELRSINPVVDGASGRYAKMKNVYWVPTVPLLVSTLREVGFRSVEVISVDVTETTEQRRTPFMRFESLEDFLDPDNRELTVEGYPRPRRALVLVAPMNVGKK